MSVSLKGRSLLALKDYSPEEIRYLLDLSSRVKAEKKSGTVHQRFTGKTLAMIFEKRSTRTRAAFETAFGEEGGHPVFLSLDDIQLGAKESIEDTARVLGRMFDCIEFRGYSQKVVETLAQYAGVPVYNGLTDEFHPTQILADLMTIEEAFGSLLGRKTVFVGDGRNNVAVSLMIGCAKMGVSFVSVAPKELFPKKELIELARGFSEKSGSTITITDSVEEGVKGADVIYTDVWASMGEEAKLAERKKILGPYQVNRSLMEKTGKKETIFMHCLPAVKGMEVTAEIIDGPASWAWEEAENRKHTIKALMLATLG